MNGIDSLRQAMDSIAIIERGPVAAYMDHMALHPDEIHNLFIWLLVTVVYWAWRWRNRVAAIDGLKGQNKFWEGYEQVIDMMLWVSAPMLAYSAFVRDLPAYLWYTLWIIILFALFGRSILDYGLAYMGRAPIKKDPEPLVQNIDVNINQPKP